MVITEQARTHPLWFSKVKKILDDQRFALLESTQLIGTLSKSMQLKCMQLKGLLLKSLLLKSMLLISKLLESTPRVRGDDELKIECLNVFSE